MLKRYLVFRGDHYYPSGGWNDFKKSFDTIEKAKKFIGSLTNDVEWAQIIDSTTGEEVSWS